MPGGDSLRAKARTPRASMECEFAVIEPAIPAAGSSELGRGESMATYSCPDGHAPEARNDVFVASLGFSMPWHEAEESCVVALRAQLLVKHSDPHRGAQHTASNIVVTRLRNAQCR